MSNLDNLINKIMSDANKEVENILAKANKQKEEMIATAYKDSEAFLVESKKNAEKEAENLKSQYILEQNIKNRDLLLGKKQEVLDNLFKKAIENLSDIPLKNFEDFLKKHLLVLDLNGDETVVVPDKYKAINIDEINKFMKSNNKTGNFKLSTDIKKISNGFVTVKNDIENDNTFVSLVDYFREDLEKELIEIIK